MPVRPVFTGPNSAGVHSQQEDCRLARLPQSLVLRWWGSARVCWRQLDADCLARPLRTDLFPLLASIPAQEEIARVIERNKPLAVRYSRRNQEAGRYPYIPPHSGYFCNDLACNDLAHVGRFSLELRRGARYLHLF